MRYWLHLVLALTMLFAGPAMASAGPVSMHDCLQQHAAHPHLDMPKEKAAPLSMPDKPGQVSLCCQTPVFAMQADILIASPLFLANAAYAPITLSLSPFVALPASPPPKTSL